MIVQNIDFKFGVGGDEKRILVVGFLKIGLVKQKIESGENFLISTRMKKLNSKN